MNRVGRGVLVAVLAVGVWTARAEEPPADPLPSSWDEPLLEDALASCALVVRARVEAADADPTIVVEKTVFGDAKPGDKLTVHGTRAVSSLEALIRAPRKGDEGIFILRRAGAQNRLELPTPTFGRFAVRNGWVAASVRDSFVRVELLAETYEEFLRNAARRATGGAADVAFLDSCRKTLATLEPANPAAQTAAHVALEGLCYGATPADVDLALRSFASPLYQVRISATRLLEKCANERAGAALLRLALHDKERAVRSVALRALTNVPRASVPAGAKAEILARLKDLDHEDIPLHAGADDPRSNELPSNLLAAFETLRSLGAGTEATPLAVELLAKDEGNVLGAACLHLTKMRDRTRVRAIVEKMRPRDNPYTLANQLIGDTLEEITGQALGDDKQAWLAWVEKHPEGK